MKIPFFPDAKMAIAASVVKVNVSPNEANNKNKNDLYGNSSEHLIL